MKRIVPAITLCMIAIATCAQEKAEIEVSYSYEFPNYKTGKRESKNDYILISNIRNSKFYSPRTEYVDSMQSTPEGMAKLNEITQSSYLSGKFDEIPRQDGSYYVVKSFDQNRLGYYDTVGMDRLASEEEIPQIDWEISDSTGNILGYECILASADLYGRRWNVWFTTDIPVQNGPWKLSGLPGLILDAETADGLYRFSATGLQQTAKPIGDVYLAERYEKVSRKELLKAKRAFFDNPLGNINAQLSSKDMKLSAQDENGNLIDNGKRIFATRDVVDFIETDY